MNLGRCTRVESWVFGTYLVKYDNEKDPVRKPLMGRRHCPEDAVVEVHHEGFRFCWCAAHAAQPTHGVSKDILDLPLRDA